MYNLILQFPFSLSAFYGDFMFKNMIYEIAAVLHVTLKLVYVNHNCLSKAAVGNA